MPDPFDITKFALGPCVVAFGGTSLGATEDAPNIKLEPEYYESKCDQSFGRPVRKILVNVKVTVSVSLKEIATGFAAVLGSGGSIVVADLGVDALAGSKALTLTPVLPTGGGQLLTFPKAILPKKFDYTPSGTKDHVLKLDFEAFFDATSGLVTIGTAV